MTKRSAPEPLQITVSGRNMPVSDQLKEFAVAKMARLSRYLDRLSRVDVVLTAEPTRAANDRNVAEATASVKGRTIRAEAAADDIKSAIDALVDKLHLQLTRTKERTRAHKGRGPGDAELPVGEMGEGYEDEDEDEAAETIEDRIVEVKQFSPKPMFPDEAIDALEELGHAFFVFLSAQTEQVSVVYRLRDGSYGLIEPAFN